MKSVISVSEIAQRLAQQALTVASMLLPGGKQVGNKWLAGDLNGSAGKSVAVYLSGEKAGRWAEYSENKTPDTYGDLLDLWRSTKRISAADSIREGKAFLGIHEPLSVAVKPKYSLPSSNGVHPPSPVGVAMRYMTQERGMTKETLETYKVLVHPGDKAIVFPCFNPKGELLNRSYRALQPDEKGKKSVWQDGGCAPCLFGWHTLTEASYLAKSIVITEGQFDAMTMHQWGIPALSVPNGNGQSWIEFEWENLEAFQNIYLAFDSDASGQKNAAETAKRLGIHRCLLVALPRKDANECLKNGLTSDDAHGWIKTAKAFNIEGVISGIELEDRVVEEIKVKPEAFSIPAFKINWHNTPSLGLYFRTHELTVWTGATSAGKTTFLNFLIVAYICSKQKVFIASMEMRAETNAAKMLRAAIEGAIPDEAMARTFIQLFGPYMIYLDRVGEVQSKELLEMMWYSFRRHGTRIFFIDSLMKIADLEEDYAAQAKFLNTLTQFVADTNSHIHLVAHTRKILPGQRPSKDDVKGSSTIANNAHNIVSISRNYKKDQMRKDGTMTPLLEHSMHDTEITVEKQRESGWVGSFLLRFNARDYTYAKI